MESLACLHRSRLSYQKVFHKSVKNYETCREVVTRIYDVQRQLSTTKCILFQKKVQYLDLSLSATGLNNLSILIIYLSLIHI